MSETVTCDNRRCSCDQCTCAECKCGVATLGELERQVMDVLWGEPGRELTGRDVVKVLPGHAYTTVATVLDRLAHKGLVRRTRGGRAIRFTATDTRAAHTAELMHEAMLVARDPDAVLARFAETVTREEAAVLRHALDELERAPK
jgi:predicted transcriptional regulator